MDFTFLLRGMLIGFSIAAPVGPIGVLCIRRSLKDGSLAGFVAGLGAATADALYGAIAAFGVTVITTALVAYQLVLQTIGGVFLCYLGITTLQAATVPTHITSKLPDTATTTTSIGVLGSAYITTFLLTSTNPLTILSFAAIFAGLGLADATVTRLAALFMVMGVFTGSALWWLLLSGSASLLRQHLTPHRFRCVNILSGSLILFVGIAALVTSLL